MTLAATLPTTPARRVAVHVTGDALRQVRAGHPWIWNRSIVRVSPAGRAGDLAVIFDDRRRFAAIGLWDPDAAIAVRVLHQGEPRPIDDDFFADRLLAAVALRQPLADDPDTAAYRLVHGENDGLPGLAIDRYGATLVAKLDSVAWVPHLVPVLEAAVALTDAERVVLRAGRHVEPGLPGPLRSAPTVFGAPPAGPVRFVEHGLEFDADVERGQKTGHFLDQRDNRRLAATRCHDAAVLDVFCNTGGFGVHAAAAGARSVHSIDLSRHAVDAARRHLELNRDRLGYRTRHTAVAADAFEAMTSLVRAGERFDVVIVDPPSFAPNARSVVAAVSAYRRLTSLAADLLGSGGTLVQASCSSRVAAADFHRLVTDELDAAGFTATNVVRTAHPLDHPIGFPQGAYLKAIVTDIVAHR